MMLENQGSAQPEQTSSNPRRLFVVAVALGGLAIVLGGQLSFFLPLMVVFTLGVPLTVMGLYIYLGKVKQGNTSHEFADSVYYLGFVYTLLALVISMAQAGDTTDVNLPEFLTLFAVALTTTIVGLIARIVIINFRETGEQSLDKAQQELARGVVIFKEQIGDYYNLLQGLQERLQLQETKYLEFSQHGLDELSEMAKKRAEKQAALLDQTATVANLAMENVAETSSNALQKSAAGLTQVLDKMASDLEASLPALLTTIQRATDASVEQKKHSLETADALMTGTAEKIAAHARKFETVITASQNTLASIKDEVKTWQQLSTDFQGTKKTIQEDLETTRALQQTLEKERARTTQEFHDTVETTRTLQQTLANKYDQAEKEFRHLEDIDYMF